MLVKSPVYHTDQQIQTHIYMSGNGGYLHISGEHEETSKVNQAKLANQATSLPGSW